MALTPKKVEINCTSNKLHISKLRVRIKRLGEEVEWKCTGGTLVVRFDKGTSPFGVPSLSGNTILSGECKLDGTMSYPYTLFIVPDDGSVAISVDPQVDVDDPGPPPGTMAARKATKKASKKASRRSKRRGR